MKELIVILSCTWKFAATFPLAIYVMKMSFYETIVYTNTGGVLGVITFTFLSKFLMKIYNKYWPEIIKIKRKPKKIFRKQTRRLVKIRSRYGLPGIVILTPLILSIPVGSFLIAKYYNKSIMNFIWLIIGQIGWSFIYTLFYTYIKISI